MTLLQIGPELWLVDGGVVSFQGFPYPTRSVVARLPHNRLWIWSPVELTAELRRGVDGLGRVTDLVSPNKLHHLFLPQWRAAYPDATLWGPSSTIRRRRDLAFAPALTDTSPEAWRGAIDQAWFRGSFALDEIVFFHREARAVLVADLIQAFDQNFLLGHWPRWSRLLARLGGITSDDPKAPIDLRLTFFDRSAARRAREKILDWNCEIVVIAHGEWARENGRDFLRRAFAWLG